MRACASKLNDMHNLMHEGLYVLHERFTISLMNEGMYDLQEGMHDLFLKTEYPRASLRPSSMPYF